MAASRPEGRGGAALALVALFLAALWLRGWGITFGLPFNYQISEQMYMYAAQVVERGGLYPLFGSYQVILLAERKLLVALQPWLAGLGLPERLDLTVQSAGMSYFLLGRLTSALLGAATVFPLYLIARRLWDRRAGLIAATLLTFSFIHVLNSHYAKPDATVGLLATTVLYLCLHLADGGRLHHYLLAGLLTGCAITAKALAWPLIVPITLAHLMAAGRRRREGEAGAASRWWWLRALFDPRLIAAAVAVLAGVVATAPQLVLDRKAFVAFYKWLAAAGEQGGMFRSDIHLGEAPWEVYLYAYSWGLGWVLPLLGLAGLALFALRRRPRELLPLLAFPVVLVAFLLLPKQYAHARYILLTLPVLLTCAAGLIWLLAERLRPRPASRLLVAAALVVALAQPAWASVVHDWLLTQEDTRTIAKQWIEENIPEGTRIALELLPWSPQLASPERPMPFSQRVYDLSMTGAYGLFERSKGSNESEGFYTVDDYVDMGYEYVITEGFTSSIPMVDPVENQAKQGFYRELDEKGELVKVFSPYKPGRQVPFLFDQVYGPTTHLSAYERPGPVIKIYRLPGATQVAAGWEE